MKVALIQPLGISEQELARQFEPVAALGAELISKDCRGASDEEILEFAGAADVLVLANLPLSADVVRGMPNLRMISVAFTGIDHIPAELCRERGIVVSNSQGFATSSVAEMVFGLLFAVYRKIVPADAGTRAGEGNAPFFGTELAGKTFGVVGMGAIGSEVARLAQAFGCRVLAYNRTPRPELARSGVEFDSLDAVLSQSDVVSLHLPLVDETRHLIDRGRLALMKPTAVLINCARGAVVDNEALTDTLLNDRIAGAGIDVYDMEPPIPADYCLLRVKERIVLTPHTAFGTTESFIKRAAIVFRNIVQWANGSPVNVKIG